MFSNSHGKNIQGKLLSTSSHIRVRSIHALPDNSFLVVNVLNKVFRFSKSKQPTEM